MGSHLLLIEHPDCEVVRYPVQIGRAEHWDGVPPVGAAGFRCRERVGGRRDLRARGMGAFRRRPGEHQSGGRAAHLEFHHRAPSGHQPSLHLGSR